MSTSSTFLLRCARPAASDIAVEVLPTPPFCEAIEMIICCQLAESPSRGYFCEFLVHTTVNNSASFVNRGISQPRKERGTGVPRPGVLRTTRTPYGTRQSIVILFILLSADKAAALSSVEVCKELRD